MAYEILKLVTIGNLTEPVSFTPPLMVHCLPTVQLVAPIVEREFGAVQVRLDGVPVPWKAAAKGGSA